MRNVRGAITEWLDLAEERGLEMPEAGSASRRADRERKTLLDRLRQSISAYDHLEQRLGDLEHVLHDIQEQIDHATCWKRFVEISGMGTPPTLRVRPLPC